MGDEVTQGAVVQDGASSAEDATLAAVEQVAAQVADLRDGLSDMAAMQGDMMRAQADGNVVLVDESQWEAMTTSLASIQDVLGEVSFVVLAVLCVTCATLGHNLWRAFSEGWR